MRKLFKGILLGVVTVILFSITVNPQANAALPETVTPSTIFTGRFIPAFIGAAYDPTEAYAAMTGLPVYVVAFEDWNGSNRPGGNSWIIGDYAVRTQIRADGTFQAQGLPEGAHYGVYFPFVLDRTNGDLDGDGIQEPVIARTDCSKGRASYLTQLMSAGDPTIPRSSKIENYEDDGSPDRNPCNITDKQTRWQYRMPYPEDKLVDSFSYAAEYLAFEDGTGSYLPLTTQVRVSPTGVNPPVFEKIRFEFAFITNRKEVDVANNINTFPIVPGNVLRVNVISNFTQQFIPSGSNVEIWALRTTTPDLFNQYQDYAGIYRLTNFPIIRGRAIQTSSVNSQNNIVPQYTFQAYAPPGDYVIITWIKETNSPIYKDWDGQTVLNVHISGMAQSAAGLFMHNTTGWNQVSLYKDWRDRLSWFDVIGADPSREKYDKSLTLFPNNNYIWGSVTDDSGNLLTSLNKGSIPDIYINAISYLGCKPDNELFAVSNTSDVKIEHFNIAETKDGMVNITADPFKTSLAPRGIYIIRATRETTTCKPNIPHSDQISIYLNTVKYDELKSYKREIGTTGLLHSYEGPKRIDLTASPSANSIAIGTDVTGGYDSGIFMWLEATGANGVIAPLSNADITIHSLGSEHVSGEKNVYRTDDLGQLHIPSTDLVPEVGAKYEDMFFTVKITKGDFIKFKTIGPTPDSQVTTQQDVDYYWKLWRTTNPVPNTGLATICNKDPKDSPKCNSAEQIASSQAKFVVPQKYNFALFNTINSYLDPEAYAEEFYTVKVQIPSYSEIKVEGQVNPIVYKVSASGRTGAPCTTEVMNKPGGCTIHRTDDLSATASNLNAKPGFDGNFVVRVPALPKRSWQDQCKIDAAGKWWDFICAIGSDNLIEKETYSLDLKVKVSGEKDKTLNGSQTFAINNLGQVIDIEPIVLNLAYDCESIRDAYIKDHEKESKGILNGVITNIKAGMVEGSCAFGIKFSDTSGKLLGLIQQYGLQTRALTLDQPVVRIYEISRNLANILFIVIFVVMAVMTILRYQPEQWHPRVLIPKLILALLFSNLSLPIAQVILDFNNFLSNTILVFASDVLKSVVDMNGAMVAQKLTVGFGGGLMAVMGGVFVNMAMGMVGFVVGTGGAGLLPVLAFIFSAIVTLLIQILSLLLLFLSRYAVIWICVAVGPWAFVASVTPFFPGLSDKWLKYLTGVAFMQTIVAGVLAIGILIMTIGIQDNSVFTQFGSFLIGFVILGLAIKIPKQTMEGFGISGLPELNAESAKGFREKAEGAYKTRQRRMGAFTEKYGMTHEGKKPGRLAKLGFRASEGIRGVGQSLPGGVGELASEMETRRRENIEKPWNIVEGAAGAEGERNRQWGIATNLIKTDQDLSASGHSNNIYRQKDAFIHAYAAAKPGMSLYDEKDSSGNVTSYDIKALKTGSFSASKDPANPDKTILKFNPGKKKFSNEYANYIYNMNELASAGYINAAEWETKVARDQLGFKRVGKVQTIT